LCFAVTRTRRIGRVALQPVVVAPRTAEIDRVGGMPNEKRERLGEES
jgi:hypothetical protein